MNGYAAKKEREKTIYLPYLNLHVSVLGWRMLYFWESTGTVCFQYLYPIAAGESHFMIIAFSKSNWVMLSSFQERPLFVRLISYLADTLV